MERDKLSRQYGWFSRWIGREVGKGRVGVEWPD